MPRGCDRPRDCMPSSSEGKAPRGLVSAVDGRHVGVVVACAGGGLEVVEPFELRFGELDLVGQGVLLGSGDAAGGGGGGGVVAAGGGPRGRCLRGGGADLFAGRGGPGGEGGGGG